MWLRLVKESPAKDLDISWPRNKYNILVLFFPTFQNTNFPMTSDHVGCQRHWALSIRPKIPVWNSGYSMRRMEQYFPVPWTQLVPAQWSSGFKFGAKIQNPKEDSFTFCLLAFRLLDRRRWSWNKRCIRWGWQYDIYRKNLKRVCDYI